MVSTSGCDWSVPTSAVKRDTLRPITTGERKAVDSDMSCDKGYEMKIDKLGRKVKLSAQRAIYRILFKTSDLKLLKPCQ